MTDRRLWRIALALALIGVGIAAYLVYVHYAHAKVICSISHGCETVQKSKYAKLAGVPVALIGLFGYLAILASLFVRGEAGRLAGAAFALVGAHFSSSYKSASTSSVTGRGCHFECVRASRKRMSIAVLSTG